MRLKDIEQGETVKIARIEWDVLDRIGEGTLCIAHDILEEREFDEDTNDWKNSSLRERLNGEFLNKLKVKMDGREPLLYTSDLATDDGLPDYGMSEDKVFLLSAMAYRAYRRWITQVNDTWWLITADSTCNSFVRIVYPDGSLGDNGADIGCHGVRPACIFPSSINTEDDGKEKTCKAEIAINFNIKAKNEADAAEKIRAILNGISDDYLKFKIDTSEGEDA